MNCTSTDIFIKKAKEVNGDKYDYSLSNYIDSKTKIKIICKKHGEFLQLCKNHLMKKEGCIKCNTLIKIKNFSKTNEEFIKQSYETHGNKYDYSLVNYINSKTKVKIICKEHGEFLQNPKHHVNNHGCPSCAKCLPLTKEIFIKRCHQIHQNKYSYEFDEFKGLSHSIDIICPNHGVFMQNALNHINGFGCSKCSGNKKLTNKEFIIQSNKTHDNKYDYSLVEYKNNNVKVKIICPIHGEFSQIPSHHKNGVGCPKCNSSKGEKLIRYFLQNNHILFIEQKKFPTCKRIKQLSFDFYLPNNLMVIEYQGQHHYFCKKMYGAKNSKTQYDLILERDKIKKEWCFNNKITLLEISYLEINKIEEIIRNKIYV